MPSDFVNLDALIPRDDFEAVQENPPSSFSANSLNITELEKGKFFYSVLRKPDFQRETANWDPEKVFDLVRSFVEGDLVPAIILWRSPSNDVFVIDGSHRLSSLISWVQDDYGDGPLSRAFFENVIPPDQEKAADKTRKLINKQIGSYRDLLFAAANPDKTTVPEHKITAKRMASLALQIQWVQGDANKAENSFFKINQQGTPIDPAELIMLKVRNCPNALAARAIIRAGVGHKYWSKFAEETRVEIEKEAKNVYDSLFTPHLQTPIKTLDIPVAGKSYSDQTLPLVFNLVNLANDVLEGRTLKQITPDGDGTTTLEYLRKARRIAYRISGAHASSLGLHPLVYFYSASGRLQPTSFLAVVAFIKELEEKNKFAEFTQNRRAFEDFLLAHKHFINQITGKYGSGIKGYEKVLELYNVILGQLAQKATKETIEKAVLEKMSFLQIASEDADQPWKQNFSTDVKSATFLSKAQGTMLECSICQGYLHMKAISFDHITDKKDGGKGTEANAQLTHPYCNSTYKDIVSKTKAAAGN